MIDVTISKGIKFIMDEYYWWKQKYGKKWWYEVQKYNIKKKYEDLKSIINIRNAKVLVYVGLIRLGILKK